MRSLIELDQIYGVFALPPTPSTPNASRSRGRLRGRSRRGRARHTRADPRSGVDVITANGTGRWLFRRFRQAGLDGFMREDGARHRVRQARKRVLVWSHSPMMRARCSPDSAAYAEAADRAAHRVRAVIDAH
jgi:hypothetical protein